MNEQNQETYRKLIEALLQCGSSQEINEILNSSQHLLNAELLQMMQQVAEELAQKGNENAANFLRDVGCQLSEVLRLSSTTTFSQPQNPNSQLDLLLQLLQAIHYSNNNPKVLYSLLQDNLDLLNDNCASVLHNWATTTLPSIVPEQAQGLATDIVNFSILIRKFPLGNQASNIEIAIAGYKVAATVFTRVAFPQEWASVQNNLGIAYRNRIRGEKAENLEKAIGYYLAALRVCTRELYPYDWSMTQQNLGIVYQNRLRGEQAENIEAAIHCFQAALMGKSERT